jgi:molecular chaperone HscB
MSKDPFSLLEITPSFKIDKKTLEKSHRALQLAVHPDRFVGKSASDKQDALAASCDISQAYVCLRTPVARAHALLSLLGHTGDLPPLEGAFLQESFSLQEDVLEAKASHIQDLKGLLLGKLAQEEACLEESFQTKNVESFAQALGRYQVISRLYKTLTLKEETDASTAA